MDRSWKGSGAPKWVPTAKNSPTQDPRGDPSLKGGRGGVKTPPQREEGFWEEGFFGRGAAKPPVAQRAGGI